MFFGSKVDLMDLVDKKSGRKRMDTPNVPVKETLIPKHVHKVHQVHSVHSVHSVYSVLSALIGEMLAARLAGMIAAKKAEIASATAATLNASGSQKETP